MKFEYSEKISNEAREWFVDMQAEDINPERNEKFLEWFLKDPAHQKAYKDYQKILTELARLSNTAEASALGRPTKKSAWTNIQGILKWLVKSSTTPTKWAMVAASFSILVMAIFFVDQNNPIDTQIYKTAVAESTTIRLQDGSEIILGGKTTLKTWTTKNERHAELMDGQAFFKIAKNPQQPFWIDIDTTAVKVVGTAFDIHKGGESVSVAVSEGIVKVFNVASSLRGKYKDIDNLESTTLIQNQKVINSTSNGLSDVTQVSVNEIAAWRDGKLFFKYDKLKNVIAVVNRYYKGNINYDENIADLQLTAAISISQIDKFPDILCQLLPIKITVIDSNHINLSAR